MNQKQLIQEHVDGLRSSGFVIAGIVFDEEYYYNGVFITLYDEGQSIRAFRKAKAKLYRERDIVGIRIQKPEELWEWTLV